MYSGQREKLVKDLVNQGRIFSDSVEKAFLNIPREEFLPLNIRNQAYIDTPLSIGNGQTISAPHMVAIMAEALDIQEGQQVLEIGTGSGYHAAIVSKLVGKKGHVFSVERFSELADFAKSNIDRLNISNISIETGDGSIGLEKSAPYDRIYVTCAAPDIPDPLVEQLKTDAKLIIPVGRHVCELVLLEKKENKVKRKLLGGCAFVPLVGKFGH